MKRPLRWYDYITINAYWMGLTTLSQTNGLVIPILVQGFVGEGAKGTFFGTLRLWTLMVAVLVQALMGMLSDRSRSRWGRRRPFILGGTLADLVFIAAIGFSALLTDMSGYWLLFGISIMLQISSNTAHGAEQGLIPDLVPEEKRGRFSGVKAVLEVPLPVILVALFVGPQIAANRIWLALLIAGGVLTLCMVLTMLVRETPLQEAPAKLNWQPFLRLLLMTGLFTAIILGLGEGVKLVGRLAQTIASANTLLTVMGVVGLAGMALAVALGVWVSVRIAVGEGAKRNPSFTWWVVNRLAFFVGTTNLSGFAVYFLQGRLGYPQEQAAAPASRLMMVVGVMILLSALPSGWLVDRFGAKRLTALSGILAVAGTVVLLLAASLIPIYIGGCLIGIATGVFFTANWALGTSLVPKAEAGRYLGISNLAGAGAGAVGAYIGGPIADLITAKVPEVPGLGYVLIFGIYGVMFLLSALVLMAVRDPVQEAASA
jgi:MFS family permease